MFKTKPTTEQCGGNDIPRTPLSFFWHVSKPTRLFIFLALLLVFLAASGAQSVSYFFKLIVDSVESGNSKSALMYGLMFPVAMFFVQSLYRTSAYCVMKWLLPAKKLAVKTLSSYAIRHSHTYFADRFAGSMLSKVNNVVGALDAFVVDFVWTHFQTSVSFLISFIYISLVDTTSGLIFLSLLIFLVVFNLRFAPQKRKLSKASSLAATKMRGTVVDIFSNAAAVRQYAQMKEEDGRIEKDAEYHRTISKKNWTFSENVLFYNSIILLFFSLSMIWLLTTRWNEGAISTGEFVFVIALVTQLTHSMIFISRAITNTARVLGEAEEGLEDLLVPYEIKDAPDARALVPDRGKLSWENVTFSYGNETVFKDFALVIPGAQRIGLVGHSGAGKTTFVSLLLRQHELTQGAILIDQQDISAVTQDSLRKTIAVVPQEPLLFHRSIKENIGYGKEGATEEEIVAVAKKAQAHEFIVNTEDGYNTLVGERGVKLSGGQKQRVAIARAMLKDAPILILDEATSALDSESEVAIQKALHELMEGKTVIAIAHRLSTLRKMDRILVLDNGEIVEDGTHTELSKAKGIYQSLWEHQAGGFLTD